MCRTGSFVVAYGSSMAIIGGERPTTVHTTLASMQDEDDKGAIEVRNADLEARYVTPPYGINTSAH